MRYDALVLTVLCLTGCMTSSEVKTDVIDAAILRNAQEIGRTLSGADLNQKPVVAVVNVESDSPKLSEYVLDRLMAELLKENKVTVVERENLELIKQEMNLHLSGEVSDESARAIGKKLGASSIVTASFHELGDSYRFVVKTINVETAELEVSHEERLSAQDLAVFLGKPKNTPIQREPTVKSAPKPDKKSASQAQKEPEPSQESSRKVSLSLAELVHFVPQKGDDITITLDTHETLESTQLYFNDTQVRITLRSDPADIKKLSLSGTGSLFTLGKGVTLVLEDITLQGVKENTHALITVESGGALIMNQGSAVTGNTVSGYFSFGGGVYVDGGTFTMSGGTISGNSASASASSFYSSSFSFGGGVYVSSGTFTMSGGTIGGNSASLGGGGVYVSSGNFTMNGGTISGNSASADGGGVYVKDSGIFQKGASGGVIYGKNAAEGLKNTAQYGAAVYVSKNGKKRNTTLSAAVALDSKNGENWE